MIVKTIKKYKKGNGFRYEISINKKDIEELNNTKEVNIFENSEYKSLQNQINSLKRTIDNKNKEISSHEKNNKTTKEASDKIKKKIELLDIEHEMLEKRNDKLILENTELLRQNKSLKNELANIDELTNKFNDLITNLDKQHNDQLKDSYEKFNAEITKYIAVNQLQNMALKQIQGLGLLDLIRNKHKKIARDEIKELDTKPVYELTKKES
jgi:chromosome segregation ATPase